MRQIVAFSYLIILLFPTSLIGKDTLVMFSGDIRGEIKPCGCDEEGDMGETYGFNFRHYGAEYHGCDKDYTGQGFDQIENISKLICSDIINLEDSKALYTIFTNESGKALDDVIFWKFIDKLILICNASNREKISKHLLNNILDICLYK